MKQKLKWVGIGLLVVLVVAVVGFCYYLGDSVYQGSAQLSSNEKTTLAAMEPYFEEWHFDLEQFRKNYTIKKVELKSSLDGHTIPADHIFSNGEENADTVVLVHGLGGNRQSVYPESEMFLKNGMNVMVYDQRSSGENTAPHTTFGFWESRDLADCVQYLSGRISESKKIGVWGMSFGGATVGVYLATDMANELVDFAILDSPLNGATDMLRMSLDEMNTGIPSSWMMSLANLVLRARLGFSYADADFTGAIAKTTVPTLLVRSTADTVTPLAMTDSVYNALPESLRTLYSVDDSKHAEIYFDHPQDYEAHVLTLIESVKAK